MNVVNTSIELIEVVLASIHVVVGALEALDESVEADGAVHLRISNPTGNKTTKNNRKHTAERCSDRR